MVPAGYPSDPSRPHYPWSEHLPCLTPRFPGILLPPRSCPSGADPQMPAEDVLAAGCSSPEWGWVALSPPLSRHKCQKQIITAAQQFTRKGKSYFHVPAALTNSVRKQVLGSGGESSRDGAVKYLWRVLVSYLTNYNTLSIFNSMYQSKHLLPIWRISCSTRAESGLGLRRISQRQERGDVSACWAHAGALEFFLSCPLKT